MKVRDKMNISAKKNWRSGKGNSTPAEIQSRRNCADSLTFANVMFPLLLLMVLSLIMVTQGCSGGTGYYGDSSRLTASGGGNRDRFTITLAIYGNSDRTRLAQKLQQTAKVILHSNDVWLKPDELGLAVNFGHFKSYSEAEKSIKLVRKNYKNLNVGPLQFCYINELSTPDPPVPADWNILNSRCVFTLQIGIYYDDPEHNYFGRKTDAVKSVKQLRQQGYQAYLLHEKKQSRVFVGCFGPNDVRKVPSNGGWKLSFSPAIKQMQKKFPYQLENGLKVSSVQTGKTGKQFKVRPLSVVVEVQQLRRESQR